MATMEKSTGRASSMGSGLLTGGLISTGITIAGATLCAILISKEKIPAGSIGYCSMILIIASSFVGSITAMNMIKHRKMYVCALSGAIYYGILLSATGLFFGGQYQGMGVTALLIIAGCGVSMLIGLRRSKRIGIHKAKIRRR